MENTPESDQRTDPELKADPLLIVEKIPRREVGQDAYFAGLDELLFGVDAFDVPDTE